MFMPVRWLAALFLASVAVPIVRADIIFLNDGFVLQGQVKRDASVEVDHETHEPFRVPKGFFSIDDGPRRVYFSPKLVTQAERKAAPNEEVILPERQILMSNPIDVPPIYEVLETTSFDSRWDRTIRFRTRWGQHPAQQHLARLSPYYTRIDGMPRYAWAAFHLTREFSPETVQQWLASNAKLKITKDLKPAEVVARRFRYCDFFAQAGWFDEAEAELQHMLADLPAEKATVEGALNQVARMRAREKIEEIKRLHHAGLLETARQRAAKFREARVPEEMIAALQELKSEQSAVAERLTRAARHFDDLPKLLSRETLDFTAIAQALRAELNPEGLARLEAFLAQADQAARQRQMGRAPALNPAELLSLAATGWLLGNAAAESKPEIARRVWKARQLVLDYLRASDPDKRQEMLAAFVKERSGKDTIDEVFQIIPHLPPPEAEGNLKERTQELTVDSAARRATKYQLRLPPEYSHGRPWPVLIVLADSGEKAAHMLDRWSEAAGENGYLLVAPEWQPALAGGYTFSETEHGIVLDVIRDLRRRFNVDSDRVFLFGLGQGGLMAFDVGLAHPDLFAGVIPMAAAPEFFAKPYFRNGFYLPFYVVNGNKIGDSRNNIHMLFEQWVMRGYPSLWIEYKGRGQEWFGGEVPNIFEWMRPKRRPFPLQQLGSDGSGTPHGNEFSMMRHGDNRYYWLSAESINDRCCTSVDHWVNVTPATMTATINTANNEIFARVVGVKQLRIWLGRNAKGQNMIDFDKPLSVRVNLAPRLNKRNITPKLDVLLEDLYLRGDRQQLYLEKLDFKM